uniref:Uncharacterized protein n=1 Tax=Anguilla anguilla TaxID=7936 RepID=A0A0E9SZD6_ANGAN
MASTALYIARVYILLEWAASCCIKPH